MAEGDGAPKRETLGGEPSSLADRMPFLKVVEPSQAEDGAALPGSTAKGNGPKIVEISDDGSYEIPAEDPPEEPPTLDDEPPSLDDEPPSLEQTSDGPTLMDEMMAAANEARQEKKDKAAAEKKRVKKDFGKGLKKGFFNSAPAKSSKGKSKRTSKAGDTPGSKGSKGPITTLKAPDPKEKSKDPLRLDEVQESMQSSLPPLHQKLQNGEWVTSDLKEKIAGNPRLLNAFADPRFAAACAELQKNPQEAMKKFQSDPELYGLLMEFCSVMGDHFTQMGQQEPDAKQGSGASTSAPMPPAPPVGPLAEEALKRQADRTRTGAPEPKISSSEQAQVDKIMADEELRTILMDPETQQVLQQCGQPGRLQQMMRDPKFGPRIRKLMDAGLVRVEP